MYYFYFSCIRFCLVRSMPLPSHSLFAITIWWFPGLPRANLLAYLFIYLNLYLLLRMLLPWSAFVHTASWEGLYITPDHSVAKHTARQDIWGAGAGKGRQDGVTGVKWPEIPFFPLPALLGVTVPTALLSCEPFWVLVWIVQLLTNVSWAAGRS